VEEKEIQDELSSIRNLMERSSKFISLSGLSGILAGIYALIGAAVAYYFLKNNTNWYTYNPHYHISEDIEALTLIGIAFIVLLASVVTGVVLSYRKAKRKGQPIWGKTSQSLLFYMATPLVTGGILIIIFIFKGHYSSVAPASRILDGLAWVGAST
jgi:predicted lysophospholipase L1 biosynthesis ABC-type transport system permease subunit